MSYCTWKYAVLERWLRNRSCILILCYSKWYCTLLGTKLLWKCMYQISENSKDEAESNMNESGDGELELPRLEKALLEWTRFATDWSKLSEAHSLSQDVTRRAKMWEAITVKTCPNDPSDIDVILPQRGRPETWTICQEDLVVEAIKCFAQNCTSLSKHGLSNLIQH